MRVIIDVIAKIRSEGCASCFESPRINSHRTHGAFAYPLRRAFGGPAWHSHRGAGAGQYHESADHLHRVGIVWGLREASRVYRIQKRSRSRRRRGARGLRTGRRLGKWDPLGAS
jgi:hypothetical protein